MLPTDKSKKGNSILVKHIAVNLPQVNDSSNADRHENACKAYWGENDCNKRMTPPILQDTRLPERLWRRLMRWIAVGDEQTTQVNLQRKIAQTNLAALLAAFASAAISIAFWLNGNPALVTAAWLNLPFPFLYLLVLHLNHRSHSVLACWTLFALLMADVMIGAVFAHGVMLAAHYYFIAFAVMTPMLFSGSHWRSAALVFALNLSMFLFLEMRVLPPRPELLQLDQGSLSLIRMGIVGSTVILLALLIGIGEYSAAISDSRLQLQASSDSLTGLPNRLALRQAFVLELGRRQREWQPMSFAMADLDFFKRVNDEWGHDAGDQALRHVSLLLSTQARAGEMVARMGGEEFGIILLTDPASALLAAQRMCRVIETTPFQYNGQSRTITISIGLAHMTPADTEQSALRRADAALYQAKHQGRNRVIADPAQKTRGWREAS